MRNLFIVVITLVLLASGLQQLSASTTAAQKDTLVARDTIQDSVRVVFAEESFNSPSESFRKKKLITSILAFPIPFGFVGLHRIYLGSEPWVPIAYLCTGGGGCGLLPLLDFIYIVTANEEEFKKYENNPRLIMFVE